MTEVVLYMQI